MMRRVAIDCVAFIAAGILVVLVHRPFGRHDFALCDHTALFHHGARALDGVVYADGPLPALLDGAWQLLVGPRYIASFYAGLLVLTLRVFVVWVFVRRIVDVRAAAALAIGCAIDPSFGGPHHTPLAYTELFVMTSAVCGVLATRSEGRRAKLLFASSGACAGLIALSQPHAVPVVAAVVGGALALLARRTAWEGFRFVAGGFLAVTIIALAVLLALGVGGTVLVDSWSRHGVHGFAALFDALSGGILVDPSVPLWESVLRGIVPPVAALWLVFHLVRRDRAVSLGMVAILVPASWLIVGLTARYVPFGASSNLPRLLLIGVAALAVVKPDRCRDWLGIEPVVAFLVSALPVISDAMTGLAARGPGPTDNPALIVGTTALAFVSTHVASRTKRWFAFVLAFVAICHLIASIGSKSLPFESPATRSFAGRRLPSSIPRLAGLRLTESRGRVLDWLSTRVPAGSSCFVVGHWPALYTILDCQNPTPIDSTFPRHVTSEELDRAAATLIATPPSYIIAYYDLTTDTRLQPLAPRYELAGNASDALDAEPAQQAMQACDALAALRVYRRIQ